MVRLGAYTCANVSLPFFFVFFFLPDLFARLLA